MATDLFASNEGLDASQPVAGADLFADPNAPGPFARGVKSGVAGVKGALYGAGALAARGATAILPAAAAPFTQELEAAALENVEAQNEIAGEGAMGYQDVVDDPTRAGEYFKYLLGQAVPSLATMFAGGGLGALAGRAVAGRAGMAAARAAGTVAPAVRTGALTGAVAPDVAMEAGSIYPEALETGVENPGLRALAGGAAAGAIDFIPLLAAEKYLKPIGKGGFGAMARGAVKGAPVGAALEGSQELSQTLVERLAAGKSLTGPDAISEYIESFLGGAAPGSVFGAAIGARRQAKAVIIDNETGQPVQETPPSTEREQGQDVNVPDLSTIDPNLSTPIPPATPQELHAQLTTEYTAAAEQVAALEPVIAQAQAAHDELVARRDALTEEAKLEVGQRRTKSEILVEKKAVAKQIESAKKQVETLGGQLHSTRTTIADLTPRMEAVQRLVAGESDNVPVSPDGDNVSGTIQTEGAVVPEVGQPKGPMRLLHATGAEVSEFDTGESRAATTTNTDALGAWFAADPKLTNQIHTIRGQEADYTDAPYSGRTYLVDVDIKNPLVVATRAELDGMVSAGGTTADLKASLIAKGYDGVKVVDDNGAGTSYVAFRPEQAKFALEDQTARAVEGARVAAGEAPSVLSEKEGSIPDKTSPLSQLRDHIATVLAEKKIPEAKKMERAAHIDSAIAAIQQEAAAVPESYRATFIKDEVNKRIGMRLNAEVKSDIVDHITGQAKTQFSKGAVTAVPESAGMLNTRQLSQAKKIFNAGNWFLNQRELVASQVVKDAEGNVLAVRAPDSRTGGYGMWHFKKGHSAASVGIDERIAEGPQASGARTGSTVPVSGVVGVGVQSEVSDVSNNESGLGFQEESPSNTGVDKPSSDKFKSNAALTQDEFDTLPEPAKFAAVDEFNRIMRAKGVKLRERLLQLVGNDPRLVVKTFMATPDSPIGSYTRVDKLKSVIALALNAKDELSVADHEGYHYAEDRLLDARERRIVANAMKPGRPLFESLMAKVRAYDIANGTNLADEVSAVPAEARAYAFEFWRRGELQVEGPVARAWQKLKQFLERVANLVRGDGFTSMEDIFRALDLGQFAERYRGDVAESGLPMMLQQQAFSKSADYLQSPEFKKWFGDSKVVDAEGKPLVVFHGTTAGFDTFSEEKRGAATGALSARMGFFFSSNKKTAEYYATVQGQNQVQINEAHAKNLEFMEIQARRNPEDSFWTPRVAELRETVNQASGPNVMPVYLSLQNPLIVDFKNSVYREESYAKLALRAQANGHDGLILRRTFDSGEYTRFDAFMRGRFKGEDIFVAFHPTQIKSAIGNTGAFDPTNPDIRFSKGAPDLSIWRMSDDDYIKNLTEMRDLALQARSEAVEREDFSRADMWVQKVREHNAELQMLEEQKAKGLPLDTSGNSVGTLHSRGAVATATQSALAEMTTRIQNGELERTQLQQAFALLNDNAQLPDPTFKFATGLAKAEVGGLRDWWFKHIATPNYVSRFSAGYKNVMNTLNTYIRYRKILAEQMLREKLPSWYKASDVDRKAAFGVMLKRTVEGYSKSSTELTSLLESLTAEQRKLYDQATTMIEGFLRAQFAKDQISRRGQLTSEGAYEKWEAERRAQVDSMIDKGYVPLRRYGDYSVRVYSELPDGKKVDIGLVFVDTARGQHTVATMYQEEIKRSGANLKVEIGTRDKNQRETGVSIEQFLGTLRRNGVEISQAERERLVLTMTNSESMIRNKMMHREGLSGYSEDSMRVLHEFGVNMSGELAYARFADALDAAMEGRAVTADVNSRNSEPEIKIDEPVKNPDGTWAETADEYKARSLWRDGDPMAGFYKGLSTELSNYVLVPDHSGGWSRRLRAAAMVYFIGGSISAGVVNAMSVPMLVVPELSVHTGYGNSLATTMGAWKDAWRYYHILHDMEKLKSDDPKYAIPGFDTNLRQAIAAAADHIFDTEIHQMLGMSQGTVYSKSRNVQRAMEAWMMPFRVSEQANRLASFIAAYRVATTGEGVKGRGKLHGQELFKFASGIVDATQNNYNESNRPGAARHPVFAMMFMFKSFPLFMIEAISLMYKQNPRSAVYMLLGLTMMTGVQGLPFAETLLDLIDTISQRIFNSPFNARRAMRNVIKAGSEAMVGADLSDVVLRGVLNDVLGVSMASRIGTGDFVPGTRLGAADADSGRVLAEMLGAPFAMVKDAAASVGKFTGGVFTGDWKEVADAIRAGGPVAMRNVVKGAEQLESGFAKDARGRKIVDVNTLDGLFQLVGLSSAKVAKMYDMETINIQTRAFYNQFSQELQSDLVSAMKAGDTERVQEINDLRNDWNRENPSMPILANAASVRRAIILSGVPLDRRSVMQWGRRIRGQNIFTEEAGQ